MNLDPETNESLLTEGTQQPQEAAPPSFDPNHLFKAQNEPPHAPVPPPYANTQPQAPQQPPVRVRRVGTLTMGAALVVTGVVVLISLFNPSFNFIMAAKLSPLVLVFIGIEILYHNFFHRDAKIKYDFLSGFICFLLICASVTVAMIPPIYEQFGPPRNAAQHRIEAEIQDIFLTNLSGLPISSLGTSVYLERPIKEGQPLTYKDLIPTDYVEIQLELAGTYTDKQQFAKDCKAILDKITATALPYDRILFQSPVADKNTSYWLEVNDKFRSGLSAQQLAQVVDDNRMEHEIEQAYEQLENQRQQQNEDMENQREELESQRQQQNEDIQRQREELNADMQRQREELNAEMEDRRNEELNNAS